MFGRDGLLVKEGLRWAERYERKERYRPAKCCGVPVLAVFVLRRTNDGESHRISVSYCPVCERVPVDEK